MSTFIFLEIFNIKISFNVEKTHQVNENHLQKYEKK